MMKFGLPIAFCLGVLFDGTLPSGKPVEKREPGPSQGWSPAGGNRAAVGGNDSVAAAGWTAPMLSPAEQAAAMETALHGAGMDRYLALARVLPFCGTEDLEKLYQVSVPGVNWRDMVFLRWAEVDPKNILAIAKQHGCENRGSWALLRTDLKEAMAQFPKMNETEQGAMIRSLGQRDPAAAQNLLDSLPAAKWTSRHHSAHAALEGLLHGMAKVNPAGACDHALQINMPIAELVADWSVREPEAALAYAQGLASNKDRALALQGIAERMLASDPASAKLLIDQMPSGKPKAKIAAQYAAEILASDPNAMQALLNEFRSPGERATIITQNVTELLAKSPSTLVSLLEKMEPVPIGSGSNQSSVRAIFDLSPKAAMNYVVATGQSTEQFSKWMDKSPEDASQWLVTCPRGDRRDQIIRQMQQTPTMQNDPEAAAYWALDMASAPMREQSFTQVYQRWHAKDPAAAETFLASNPKVTPELRNTLPRRRP
jgi:hypothetical protein